MTQLESTNPGELDDHNNTPVQRIASSFHLDKLRDVPKKTAALVGAGAIMVGGVGVGCGSSGSSSGKSPRETVPTTTTEASTQNGTTVENGGQENKSGIDALEYTKNYIKGMQSGENQFAFFNGNVVVDDKVKIYRCIDPEFRDSGAGSCLDLFPWYYTQELAKHPDYPTYLAHDARNKFGSGFRPAMLPDQNGNIWLAFTIESGGYRAFEGFGSTKNSYDTKPVDQLDLLFFIPLKGNEGHIKFYLPEPDQPTFLAGAVVTFDKEGAQELGSGNFYSTTPGFNPVPGHEIESSDSFAQWTTSEKEAGTSYYTNGSVDEPVFDPMSRLDAYTSHYTESGAKEPLHEYTMPSPQEIKQLISQAVGQTSPTAGR